MCVNRDKLPKFPELETVFPTLPKIKKSKGCPVKDCEVEDWEPKKKDPNCMCGEPLMISIPAGEHYHPCSIHPEYVIKGEMIWC